MLCAELMHCKILFAVICIEYWSLKAASQIEQKEICEGETLILWFEEKSLSINTRRWIFNGTEIAFRSKDLNVTNNLYKSRIKIDNFKNDSSALVLTCASKPIDEGIFTFTSEGDSENKPRSYEVVVLVAPKGKPYFRKITKNGNVEVTCNSPKEDGYPPTKLQLKKYGNTYECCATGKSAKCYPGALCTRYIESSAGTTGTTSTVTTSAANTPSPNITEQAECELWKCYVSSLGIYVILMVLIVTCICFLDCKDRKTRSFRQGLFDQKERTVRFIKKEFPTGIGSLIAIFGFTCIHCHILESDTDCYIGIRVVFAVIAAAPIPIKKWCEKAKKPGNYLSKEDLEKESGTQEHNLSLLQRNENQGPQSIEVTTDENKTAGEISQSKDDKQQKDHEKPPAAKDTEYLVTVHSDIKPK